MRSVIDFASAMMNHKAITYLAAYLVGFIFGWIIYQYVVADLVFASTASKEIHSYEIDDPATFIKSRIMLYEGFSSTKYACAVSGHALQGYGRNVKNKKTPAVVTEHTADRWLTQDIEKCMEDLDEKLPWWRHHSAVRRAAMIDLVYNMGIDRLLTFKEFLSNMRRGRYTEASRCLKNSKYARQTGVRAREVSTAIRYGKWVPMKEKL